MSGANSADRSGQGATEHGSSAQNAEQNRGTQNAQNKSDMDKGRNAQNKSDMDRGRNAQNKSDMNRGRNAQNKDNNLNKNQAEQQNREQNRGTAQEQRSNERNATTQQRGNNRNAAEEQLGRNSRLQGNASGTNVQLNDQQRNEIRATVIEKSGAPRVGHVDFDVTVGTAIPRGRIHVVPVPETLVRIEPAWRGFSYFVYEDEIVVVDPHDYKIVAVLPV
jgi:hypothetical protein